MTWARRELPILEALFALEEEGQNRVWSGLIAERTGLSEDEVVLGLVALKNDGYYRAQVLGAESKILVSHTLSEKARRAIGQWPADSFDAFVDALKARLAQEEDPEVQSRLRRAIDGIVGMGRDIAVEVIASAMKQAGGL